MNIVKFPKTFSLATALAGIGYAFTFLTNRDEFFWMGAMAASLLIMKSATQKRDVW